MTDVYVQVAQVEISDSDDFAIVSDGRFNCFIISLCICVCPIEVTLFNVLKRGWRIKVKLKERMTRKLTFM